MRTETITRVIYTFEELSDKAKQKAIDNLSSINVDYDWWDSVYEDANQVGITITSFDLDRNRHAESKICNPEETAELILENHGQECETYKTAQAFMNEYKPLKAKFDRIEEINERFSNHHSKLAYKIFDYGEKLENEIDELKDDFKKSITEDYSINLQKEYEYLCSDEAIREHIESNDYEFMEDGKLA